MWFAIAEITAAAKTPLMVSDPVSDPIFQTPHFSFLAALNQQKTIATAGRAKRGRIEFPIAQRNTMGRNKQKAARFVLGTLSFLLVLAVIGMPQVYALSIKAGAGLPPAGANDIDVCFSSNLAVAGLDIAPVAGNTGGTGTTIAGNPPGVVSNAAPGCPASSQASNARVRWTSPIAMVGVQGWSIAFIAPNVNNIDGWFFTIDGAQVGVMLFMPVVTVSGIGLELEVVVSIPTTTSTMNITDFQIFAAQSPSLENNMIELADFSSSPFAGSPVFGIPASFILDATDPSITFTAAVFPDLASLAGSVVGVTGIADGASFRSVSSVPEPSTLTLLGLGALGMLGYGLRRRKQQY